MLKKIIFSVVFCTLLGASVSFASERIGVVGAANKNISAINQDKEKRGLKLGDDVFFKETIRSDDTGNAQLMFVDKSALTIGPNSSVVIDEFVYNPTSSNGNLLMRGTKGTFRFIGGALSKKNAVKIKTPVGTIGIRGGIAIININPVSGATDATFVYGDVMTFENLAGDVQSIQDRGTGLAVNTPTEVPKIFRATTAQMASQVQALAGRPGTSAGADVIPTDELVGEQLILDGEGSNDLNDPDSPNNENSDSQEGEKSSKDEKSNENNSESNATNKRGKEGEGKERSANRDRKGESRSGERASSEEGGYVDEDGNYYNTEEVADNKEKNDSQHNSYAGDKRQTSSLPDDGYTTEDGGYVDGEGKYHSPSEVKAYMEGQNGEQITRVGKVDGTDGGYNNPDGGYYEGGEYYGDSYGGEYYGDGYGGDFYNDGFDNYDDRDNGGYQTNDGGYVDGDGVYYSATEVDAYLAENGGFFDPYTGEYVADYDPALDTTINDTINDTTTNTSQDTTGTNTSTNLTNVDRFGLYTFVGPSGNTFDEGDIKADSTAIFDSHKLELTSIYSSNTLYGSLTSDTSLLLGGVLVPQTGYIPINYASGYSFGTQASGWKYISPNRNMFIHRLELGRAFGTNFGINDQHNFVVGQQVSSFPTSGRQFFSFLPDMNKYLSSGSIGFFDWNIVDTQLLNNTSSNIPSASSRGMLVDWSKKSFLGGRLDWSAGKLKAAYGKVFSGSFEGQVVNYGGISGLNRSGFLNVFGNEVYGSGSTVDGFIADGNIFGSDILTPMVSSSLNYNNNYDNELSNLKGFMGGFIVNKTGSTINTYSRYWNTDITKLQLYRVGSEIRSADIDLTYIDHTGGATPPSHAYADFGDGTSNYSYIDDNAYALKQTDFTNGGNGALVSSKLVTQHGCSSCNYVHWGVWAGERVVDNATNNVDVSHLIPYIAGSITDNAGITSGVTGNYSGPVFGNILSGSNNLTNHVGTMSADITFDGSGNASIPVNDLQLNIGSYTLNNDTAMATSTGIFNPSGLQGTDITSGQVNGALFGPNAENIGGNFKFNADNGDKGSGVYLGSQ